MIVLDRLPVDGAWLALNPPGHARGVYDLVGIAEASTRIAERSLWSALWRLPVHAFYGWRRRVVAPARGVVRVAHDEDPDRPAVNAVRDVVNGLVVRPLRSRRDPAGLAGNHVIIEVDGGCVLLAHLRYGSVRVRPGQAVEVGETVGEVGNSGNSIAPHVHVQAAASTDMVNGDIVAWRLASHERWTGTHWQVVADAPPTMRTPIRAGA